MKQSKVLESIAYHEAGHAVVTWACGHFVGPITTRPSDGDAGSVMHDEYGEPFAEDPLFLDNEWWVDLAKGDLRKATPTEARIFALTNELTDMAHEEIEVLICAAGEIAQVRIGCGSEGCNDDREKAAFEVPDADRRAALYERARSLLDDPLIWGAVTALADALMAQRELGGEEAVHIIRTAALRTLS